MAAVDMSAVLADIAARLVTCDQYDTIGIPDSVHQDAAEEYRLTVVTAMTRTWAMRDAAPGELGSRTVVLTSLGEYWSARMNPGRYTSARAVEVLDGKVSIPAVTA